MIQVRYGNVALGWDERQAAINRQKHGVSFEEAVTVFADPLARIFDDPERLASRLRFLLVGHSMLGRLMLVVHVEQSDVLRILSARKPTPRERRDCKANA